MIDIIIKRSSFLEVAYIIRDTKLVQILYRKKNTINFGDVYKAKVVEYNSGLNRFFVRIGESIAILKDTKNVSLGSKIMVQVIKEATSPNKYPEVTLGLNFNSWFLAYNPNLNKLIYSKLLEKDSILEYLNNSDYNNIVIRRYYKKIYKDYFNNDVNILRSFQDKVTEEEDIKLNFIEYILFYNLIRSKEDEVINLYVDDMITPVEVNNIKESYPYLQLQMRLLSQYSSSDYIHDIKHLKEDNLIIINESVTLNTTLTDNFSYIDIDYNGRRYYKSDYNLILSILEELKYYIQLYNVNGQIFIDSLKGMTSIEKENIILNIREQLKNDIRKVKVLGFSHLGLIEISREKIKDNNKVFLNSFEYNLLVVLDKIRNYPNSFTKLVFTLSHKNKQYLEKIAKEEIAVLTKYTNLNYDINNYIGDNLEIEFY